MEFYKLCKLDDANGNLNCRWYVYYSYVHPDTNKFQRFKVGISQKLKTKTARFKRYDELKKHIDSKLLQGWNPFEDEKPELMTCIKALNLFLKVKEKTLRRRSFHTYSSFISRFINYLLKNKMHNIPVSQFSYYHAQKMMDYLITNLKINNRTYNNYVKSYRSIFNFFEKRELLLKNPWEKIENLKEEEGKIVAFTADEWEIVKNNLEKYDHQLWLAAMFIYYTAMRPQEIMRLKFSEVDMQRQKIYSLSANSKNKRQQVIEIPDQFLEILKAEDWNYPSNYYLFSKNLIPGIKENYPNRIAERWRKFANKFNIKERKIYDFKHNAAGRLIDAGFNSRDIQFHLRHHSLDQTEQYLSKFRNTSGERLKHSYPSFG